MNILELEQTNCKLSSNQGSDSIFVLKGKSFRLFLDVLAITVRYTGNSGQKKLVTDWICL